MKLKTHWSHLHFLFLKCNFVSQNSHAIPFISAESNARQFGVEVIICISLVPVVLVAAYFIKQTIHHHGNARTDDVNSGVWYVLIFTDILAGFTFNNRVLRLPAIVLLNTTFRRVQ